MIVEIYVVRTATKITSKTIKKIILIMLTPNGYSPFRMYMYKGRGYIAYMYMYMYYIIICML